MGIKANPGKYQAGGTLSLDLIEKLLGSKEVQRMLVSIRPEMGHTAAPQFHTETLPVPSPSPFFLIRGLAHPSSLLSPSAGTFVGAVSTKMDHSVGHSLHYQYNRM